MPRYRFLPTIAPAYTDQRVICFSALEAYFPRILNSIQALWGYPELNHYFNQLTVSDRAGREGFPTEVWEEIYLLMSIHEHIIPTKP
ncbi:MAG: hypothetical protein ABI351_08385 [Herbaspirillum sp.]